MDNFDAYGIQMDGDCLHQDFDDYDLYGERMISDEDDYGNDIEFE